MNKNDNPFKFLENYDVAEVARILTGELPFVAGAALSRMSPLFNAKVMANMQDSMRNEVAVAISKYRTIPTEVMFDIAEELEKKLKRPQSGKFIEQKNSLLSSLDLGAISQAINELKIDKTKQQNKPRHSAPEPVESRIIRPEEYEEYLRGETKQPHITPKQEKPRKGLNPDNFKPTMHTRQSGSSASSSGQFNMKPQQAELTPETKKELALQQALLHTRNKKQDTRIAQRPQPKSPPRKTSYKPQKIDGMALAAHILRESTPELRRRVMNEVPELYNKLNNRMFDFADLEHSSRETIGKIFTGLDPEISALALRFASEKLKNTALTSVSKRKSLLIIDEFKNSANAKVRLTAIEEAQQEVIDYAIELQNRGEIIIDPNDSSIV